MWIVEIVTFCLVSGAILVPVISPAVHRGARFEKMAKSCPEIFADFPGKITTCPQPCAEDNHEKNNAENTDVGH